MTLLEVLNEIKRLGYPIALIAKKINKDPSTLQKWINGKSLYLSKETQEEVWEVIKDLKNKWEELDI